MAVENISSAKFVKLSREGFPIGPHKVLSPGRTESVLLIDGEKVKLYNFFMYEDHETRSMRNALNDQIGRK
jgi:hypothetical protein